jgi:predicted RNase H-like nuclease (RuvC/YqgF family)
LIRGVQESYELRDFKIKIRFIFDIAKQHRFKREAQRLRRKIKNLRGEVQRLRRKIQNLRGEVQRLRRKIQNLRREGQSLRRKDKLIR